MPYFTIQVSPLGALIDALIGVSAARNAALVAAQQPVPPAVTVRALIDTGASISGVDPSVLTALALQPSGNTLINTPTTGNQPQTMSTYDVGLLVPNHPHSPFFLGAFPVVQTQPITQMGYQALIGTDVLRLCYFTFDGRTGLFTLAY